MHDYSIDDEDREEDFDCGFIPGDGCLMAGTEDCDFECPFSRLIYASPYFPNCDLLGNEANDPDTLENDEPQW